MPFQDYKTKQMVCVCARFSPIERARRKQRCNAGSQLCRRTAHASGHKVNSWPLNVRFCHTTKRKHLRRTPKTPPPSCKALWRGDAEVYRSTATNNKKTTKTTRAGITINRWSPLTTRHQQKPARTLYCYTHPAKMECSEFRHSSDRVFKR